MPLPPTLHSGIDLLSSRKRRINRDGLIDTTSTSRRHNIPDDGEFVAPSMVDYATVFLFRILMFVDSGLRAGMGPESSHLERRLRFKGRVFVLSLLTFLLYPFLWAWTIIGSMWFSDTQGCLPEEGQKWGFLIWLVFSYCGLICIACISAGKWLLRRQSHFALVPNAHGVMSEIQVFLDMIRAPGGGRTIINPVIMLQPNELASYPQGLFAGRHGHNLHVLQAQQRERVESAIQQLPKMCLTRVSEYASQCPICLEDFEIGTEVRGLPCHHTFHVPCIDAWLRLNAKCPHCRASVFPDLDTHRGASLPALPRLLASRSRRSPNGGVSSGGGLGGDRTAERVVVVSVPSTDSNSMHISDGTGSTRESQTP